MFYLRYDDIEGLFRDAAEHYHINADKAFDWDRVNRSVHEPNEEKNPGPEKNNKRKFVFWFLLVLSLGLLSYNIWSIESAKNTMQNISRENKSIQNNQPTNNRTSVAQDGNNSTKNQQTKIEFLNTNRNEKTLIGLNLNTKQKQSVIENSNANYSNAANENIMQNKITNADINPTPVLKENFSLNDQPHKIEKNIPALLPASNTTSSIQSSQKNIKEKNARSKFYVGAFTAPDITVIKFQQTNGVGVTFGLTAGYQLNKKWSIESGISLDTKKYYTSGEYFNKSNVPALYNGQLLSVNGNCNMFEMPINIRYKFPSNSDHNFTAAVGTSSYFMTKESYNYSMIAWGQTVKGTYTNYPSSTHLFAVINLSAGYEKKFNNLSLLIEPYYKVPVKGIGTGSLYMSSAGMNIGIKKYFGKK